MGIAITVIIPVYNGERFAARAAKSVLNQPAAEHIELILVNDGSGDGSGAVCDAIAAQYANVSAIHKENGGVSSARNLGLESASGDYVAFLDADDWWEPGVFDTQMVQSLQTNVYDLYCFSCRRVSINEKYETFFAVKDAEVFYDVPSRGRKPFLFHHSANFYRRSFLMHWGFRYLPVRIHEDVPFVNLCVAFARSIKYIDTVLFSYWMNPSSCMHTKVNTDLFHEAIKAYRIEEKEFEMRGIAFEDLDRMIVSFFAELLPAFCSEMCYRAMREFAAKCEAAEYMERGVLPWSGFLKRYRLWQRHPFIFWLKCRIYPGIPYAVKAWMSRTPAMQRLYEFLWYRCIQGWTIVNELRI